MPKPRETVYALFKAAKKGEPAFKGLKAAEWKSKQRALRRGIPGPVPSPARLFGHRSERACGTASGATALVAAARRPPGVRKQAVNTPDQGAFALG